MRHAVVLAVALLTVLLYSVASAQQDITPPVLLDIQFSPKQIDTSNSPATITVTVHVTDDLSGVRDVALFFRRPGTTQQAQIEFRSDEGWSEIVAGNNLDGWHRATMTLPRYSAYGEWELYCIVLVDWVGNRIDLWKPDNPGDESSGWLPLFNDFIFTVGGGQEPQQPPEGPQEPQNPEEPQQPQEPEEPVEPQDPQEPQEPQEPEEPQQPEQPQEPLKPEQPQEPEVPAQPSMRLYVPLAMR